MNTVTILGGIFVLAIAGYAGYAAIQLFIEGGTTPLFGGIALSVVAIMSLVIGIALIGMGFAGVVQRLRNIGR